MTPAESAERARLVDGDDIIRFNAKTMFEGDCLVWTAAKTRSGYGQFRLRGAIRYAHHVSWLIAHGEFPDKWVLHRCDNPICVLPAHLYLGDHKANMADVRRRGRAARKVGEANGRSRLTEPQVLEIRRRSAESVARLAREFGVGTTQIRKIISRERWAHLPIAFDAAHKGEG